MRRALIGPAFRSPRGKRVPRPRMARMSFTATLATLLATLALGLSACALTTTPSSPTPTATTATATPTTGGTLIKVYFSKDPDSLTTYGPVFPVDRVSPSADLKTSALQLLLAGPTVEERAQGYFSELNSILTGPSHCWAPHPVGGPDFTLTMNMKGTTPEQGTVTVTFCRQTRSGGIGTDARITFEINATLKQFSDVTKVVILTVANTCFGDQSGQNACLK
ncbi:MAG TPA: GerMN domain-containing protein [Ktedonobacterales bacterium]